MTAARRRRPRRVLGPRHGRACARGPDRPHRGRPVPQPRRARARAPVLGRARPVVGCPRRLARPRRRRGDRRRFVGGRLRPHRRGRAPGRQPVLLPRRPRRRRQSDSARTGQRRRPVRGHRHPAAAVQHRLPARRRNRERAPGAAHPGPVELLADRCRGVGGDQCLHDRAHRPGHRRLVGGAGRPVRDRPGLAGAGHAHRHGPGHAPAGGRRSDRARRLHEGDRHGQPRHGRRGRRRPLRGRAGRPISPAARGRSSASNARRRSPRSPPSKPDSRTSGARTGRSGSCATWPDCGC